MAGFGAPLFGADAFGSGVTAEAPPSPAPSSGLVTVFSAGREGFLDGTISWTTAVIKASLLRSYTFSDEHRVMSDVTASGGTVVATAALIDRTVTNGIADAGDTTFTAVPAGAAIPAVVIFQASAVTGGGDVAPSAQRLIGHVSLTTGTSVVPIGSDITLTWSGDRTRIFML